MAGGKRDAPPAGPARGGGLMRRRRYLLPLLALVATALFYNWAWLPGSSAPGYYPRSVRSEHFVVRYTSWGSDRAAAAFAHRVSREAEAALAAYRKYGFKDPFGRPPWEITLQDLGEEDLGTAEGWPDAPTSMVLSTILADLPIGESGGLPATIAHELFHGIQAAYVPDLDRLPDFLVEGTPDACSYAVLDNRRVKDALLIDTVAYYTEEGRLDPLARGEHAAAGYWTVLADRFGGPRFCRELLEQAAGSDTATALQRVTGLPPAALLPVVALRLYGEYVWRADELGRNSPLPPDPAARFDLSRPPAGLAQRLRAGEPVTLGADDGGAPLTVLPQAVAAVSLDGAWRLPGHLEVTVQADAPVSVYLLHGGDDAARLADFAAVARRGGTPFVLTDDGGSRSILLVLAEGTDRLIGYRLTLRAAVPGAAPTPLQPLPELLRHLETAG